MELIVSIHDVAPSTEAEVRWLLDQLDAVGVRRRVLKVIPHERASADLRYETGLVALLHAEVERGSEVVLHGWTHAQAGTPWGPPLDVLRARLFGGGRAEFLSIGDAEVANRLRAGVALLTELGMAPRGLCAPGWLARPSLASLAQDAGLDYVVWLTRLERVGGTRVTVLPTGYLGVGGPEEALAQVGGLIGLTAAERTGTPLRIVLHPQRAPASAHAHRAIRLAGALRRHRSVVTYAELLDATA